MASVLCVVGARPNFVKMAPVSARSRRSASRPRCSHTGQHYDRILSDSVMEQLGLPAPTSISGSAPAATPR